MCTSVYKCEQECTRVPGGATFQISSLKDVRKSIKKAPIHHLQVGSLEDRWFLTHFLEVPDGLEVLYFKFQVSRMSGSPSRRPLSTISWLDPWRSWLFCTVTADLTSQYDWP